MNPLMHHTPFFSPDESLFSSIRSFPSSITDLATTLAEWSSINTHSTNLQGQIEMSHRLRAEFEPLSDRVQYVDLPQLKKASLKEADKSGLDTTTLGPIVVAEKNLDAQTQIIFSGHYDTVFAPQACFEPIFSPDSGILKGPGVSDMKGGILIMREALRIFHSLPHEITKRIGWKVILTPDEEIGSPLSRTYFKSVIENLHGKQSFAIVTEPTLMCGSFVEERPGSLTLFLSAHGKKAHAGRDYWKGKNALTALIDVLFHLERVFIDITGGKENENKTTVTVAELFSGEAANIIPDKAVASINIRSQSLSEITYIYTTFLELLHTRSRDGILFSLRTESFRPPKHATKTLAQLKEMLASASRTVSSSSSDKITWSRSGGVSDGNIFEWYGLPTLDGIGVTGGGLHTYDEWCNIKTIDERAKQLSALLLSVSFNPEAVPILAAAPFEPNASEKGFYSSPYHER